MTNSGTTNYWVPVLLSSYLLSRNAEACVWPVILYASVVRCLDKTNISVFKTRWSCYVSKRGHRGI